MTCNCTHTVYGKVLCTTNTGILFSPSAPELAEHYSTVYGINYCSPLDSLSNFEVAEGAMIPDIMHAMLESVLPLEMKYMLKVLIIGCICDDYICMC